MNQEEFNPMDVVKASLVPETLLKKRRQKEEEIEKKREERKSTYEEKRKKKRQDAFITAEKLVKIHREHESDNYRHIRCSKRGRPETSDPSDRVMLLIRHRGSQSVSSKSGRLLRRLGLTQENTAVFAVVTPELLALLPSIRPHLLYGNPSLKTIEDLIKKRGYYRDGDSRHLLSSNVIVEEKLGSKDLLCIEDLVHEIHRCGAAIEDVLQFLSPFRLSRTAGKFQRKVLRLNHEGKGGKKNIDEIVEKML